MCDAENRLGMNGVHEIKAHPFFEGIDWKKMRNVEAPFIPDLVSDEDCSRFDKFEEEEPFYATANASQNGGDDKKKR